MGLIVNGLLLIMGLIWEGYFVDWLVFFLFVDFYFFLLFLFVDILFLVIILLYMVGGCIVKFGFVDVLIWGCCVYNCWLL